MSSPTRNRPSKGKLSPRSVSAWKAAAHNGFVHSAPDSNLQTENLPPPTESRFPFSLNGTLAKYPHLEITYVEDWNLEDSQLSTQPHNIPAAVHRIAGERFNPCDIGSGLLIP